MWPAGAPAGTGNAFPVEVQGHQIAIYHVDGSGFHCTGKGQGAPIEEDLKVFPIKVEGNDILVALP